MTRARFYFGAVLLAGMFAGPSPAATDPVTPEMLFGRWYVVRADAVESTVAQKIMWSSAIKGMYYEFNPDFTCVIKGADGLVAFTWNLETTKGNTVLYFAKASDTKQLLVPDGPNILYLTPKDESVRLTLHRAPIAHQSSGKTQGGKKKNLIGAWKVVSARLLNNGKEIDPLTNKAISEGLWLAFYESGLCINRRGNEAFDLSAFTWKLTARRGRPLLTLGKGTNYQYYLQYEGVDSISLTKVGDNEELIYSRQTAIWSDQEVGSMAGPSH